VHRGPDDGGLYLADGVGLGVRRLSIIDLAGGHQPLTNEDGSIHVVFNGEIYNHQALRSRLEGQGHRFATKTDTEVLVHLYEEYGHAGVHLLRGMVLKHLRTTNPVESPFAAVRRRTAAAKRYTKVDNATAVIWKTLRIAEQRFRRPDAPELLLEVAEGTVYVDGRRVKHEREVEKKKAAA
jgi:asparagine synthase (glutamine-hydrolysing)